MCGRIADYDFNPNYRRIYRWYNFLPARRCASAVLAMARCLSVRPSVCYKLELCQTAEGVELVFGTEATLDLSYIALEGNQGISKK